MGISKNAVRMFLHEAQRSPLSGSLLTLGAQDVFVTPAELHTCFAEFGREVPPEIPVSLSPKPDLAKGGFVSDRYLYSILGFSEFKSLDASSFEGSDIVFDLNSPDTPAELSNRWDVIFDGGTLEHVFHIPNALANLARCLKVGGRIIHVSPSSNHMDHGFYMFSPTFFWDYYRANKFDVHACQVFRYMPGLDTGWIVSDYVPGSLTRVSMGGLDDALYGIIMIAAKSGHSTSGVIPQQGLYADELWKSDVGTERQAAIAAALDPSFTGKGLGLRVKYKL